jgi:hypothetical protein
MGLDVSDLDSYKWMMKLSRAVVPVCFAFAVALGGAVPAVAGVTGGTAAAPIETNYQDPVTALPPVSRPPVRHCTVTVMQHDFANSYGQPFTGTVAPPAACPGPWTKVVMDPGTGPGRDQLACGQGHQRVHPAAQQAGAAGR